MRPHEMIVTLLKDLITTQRYDQIQVLCLPEVEKRMAKILPSEAIAELKKLVEAYSTKNTTRCMPGLFTEDEREQAIVYLRQHVQQEAPIPLYAQALKVTHAFILNNQVNSLDTLRENNALPESMINTLETYGETPLVEDVALDHDTVYALIITLLSPTIAFSEDTPLLSLRFQYNPLTELDLLQLAAKLNNKNAVEYLLDAGFEENTQGYTAEMHPWVSVAGYGSTHLFNLFCARASIDMPEGLPDALKTALLDQIIKHNRVEHLRTLAQFFSTSLNYDTTELLNYLGTCIDALAIDTLIFLSSSLSFNSLDIFDAGIFLCVLFRNLPEAIWEDDTYCAQLTDLATQLMRLIGPKALFEPLIFQQLPTEGLLKTCLAEKRYSAFTRICNYLAEPDTLALLANNAKANLLGTITQCVMTALNEDDFQALEPALKARLQIANHTQATCPISLNIPDLIKHYVVENNVVALRAIQNAGYSLDIKGRAKSNQPFGSVVDWLLDEATDSDARQDAFQLLLEAGMHADVILADGNHLLNSAIHMGYTDLVIRLLERGVSFNIPNNYGEYPLTAAIRKGNVKCVEALLKAPNSRFGEHPDLTQQAMRALDVHIQANGPTQLSVLLDQYSTKTTPTKRYVVRSPRKAIPRSTLFSPHKRNGDKKVSTQSQRVLKFENM